MPKDPPRVSVIIPHYNMHSYLPRAVNSVAIQDYENIELIIVDDGSDQAVSSAQFSADSLPVKLLEIEHGGKARAVNRGFEEATGEYFAILDADDQLPEGSLSKRVKTMEEDSSDLSIGSFEVRYGHKTNVLRPIDKLIGRSNIGIIRKLLTDIISPFHQNAMLFSRKLLDRVGGMAPEMLRGQDKDFAVRLLVESRNTVFVTESVYVYNRYDRPLSKRISNRCLGMKYKLIVIARHTAGWRRVTYLGWSVLVEGAKLIHDLFGIYKK